MKRFWLVRHGESEGNIDMPQPYRGAPKLTERGWEQARAFAERFSAAPDLIVASTFVRAQQSAEPLQRRFPSAATAIWPVHEFTPLASKYYENARMSARRPAFLQFFADANPNTNNGPGSESFAEGIDRAINLFHKLRQSEAQTTVVFSHATFLRMVYWAWLYGDAARAKTGMGAFGQFLRTHKFANMGFVQGHFDGPSVYLSGIQTK